MLSADVPAVVAQATGEDLKFITRQGFSLAQKVPGLFELDYQALWVDCPCCGRAIFVGTDARSVPEEAGCDRCDAYYEISPHDVYEADPVLILTSDR